MNAIVRMLALAMMLTFTVGTLSFAGDPAPAPAPAPTDEKDKKNPSGPKMVENEKGDQTDKDKKDEKGR
jgi:hypothetical protein